MLSPFFVFKRVLLTHYLKVFGEVQRCLQSMCRKFYGPLLVRFYHCFLFTVKPVPKKRRVEEPATAPSSSNNSDNAALLAALEDDDARGGDVDEAAARRLLSQVPLQFFSEFSSLKRRHQEIVRCGLSTATSLRSSWSRKLN